MNNIAMESIVESKKYFIFKQPNKFFIIKFIVK